MLLRMSLNSVEQKYWYRTMPAYLCTYLKDAWRFEFLMETRLCRHYRPDVEKLSQRITRNSICLFSQLITIPSAVALVDGNSNYSVILFHSNQCETWNERVMNNVTLPEDSYFNYQISNDCTSKIPNTDSQQPWWCSSSSAGALLRKSSPGWNAWYEAHLVTWPTGCWTVEGSTVLSKTGGRSHSYNEFIWYSMASTYWNGKYTLNTLLVPFRGFRL